MFAVVAGLLHLAHAPAPAYAADEICNLAPDGTLTCPSDPSNEPTPAFPPPELLNPRILAEATPAQADALRRLQEQAVTVVMTRHHLPASDRDEVQSWGRTEAQAALWALVYEAIDTEVQDRTSDQQHAVDWMASLVRAQAVNTAKAAAGEYASWVGLDVDEYWSKVNSGISQDQLTSFLSIDARNYNTVDTTARRPATASTVRRHPTSRSTPATSSRPATPPAPPGTATLPGRATSSSCAGATPWPTAV